MNVYTLTASPPPETSQAPVFLGAGHLATLHSLGLGALYTAVVCLDQPMGADGLNYLTLGSAYWRGIGSWP